MAVTGHVFPQFALGLAASNITLPGGTWKVALGNAAGPIGLATSGISTAKLFTDWTAIVTEITGTGYTAGGNAIGTKTNSEASGLVSVGAANTSWTTATFSGVFGDLVYDNTITNKNAYCWNYFGGTQSVTSGTFTIAWNGGNIFTVTIT